MSAELLRKAASAIRNDAPALDADRAWHPAVALAVAQLLNAAAAELDCVAVYSDAIPTWLHAELENLARAYLGGDA